MIENDPTLPEAEIFETLKSRSINYNHWTALENQNLLEANTLWGWDDSAISQHVGTKSIVQVREKKYYLQRDMKRDPAIPMSDFLYTDSNAKRQ